jgi:hypothetical protein
MPGPAPDPPAGLDSLLGRARRTLCLGIGGGGDVVGALATAELARTLGSEAILGGVTWERGPVDPAPGPRRLAEIEGLEDTLNRSVALAGPATSGPGGFLFAESRIAGFLGEPTVLVDPHAGPAALADDLDQAARVLRCDLIALVDVGGDVLAHGHEPGLASPLCDSMLLAAAAHLAGRRALLGAVFGPSCDGELSSEEVLARIAEVAAGGGLLGAWGMTPPVVERLAGAVRVVPTEASAQALRCARGETGSAPIRGGARHVPLSPLGAITFYFDPVVAVRTAARLAAAIRTAGSLHEANRMLHELRVPTELGLEASRAQAG